MRPAEFDKALRGHVERARRNWLDHARSDDPDTPDYVPLLVVRTKRAEYIIPLPGYDRVSKHELLQRTGFLFYQRRREKVQAVFFVAESWMAPATGDVIRHVRRGGGVAELTDHRREVLFVSGLQPNGTGNAAYLDIIRSESGEATLGEATYLPEDVGRELVFATLGRFYDGYRIARGAQR